LLYQGLFLRIRKKSSKVTDMDLLLSSLGKPGVLLGVTAVHFALQALFRKHDGEAKANFTWEATQRM